jgi:hypothetical protein
LSLPRLFWSLFLVFRLRQHSLGDCFFLRMKVWTWLYATPVIRFLMALCFQLPLSLCFGLWFLATMMARTFNDVYCTSPTQPCLGRALTPILD